jgi:hypothetical protein
MSPRTDIRVLITLIALGLAVSVTAKESDKEAGPPVMNVQVNNAAVRQAPSFLSEVSATLNYGDKVGMLEQGEGWQKVRPQTSSVTGWMHASALTKKEIKLEAGDTDANVKASQQELAAGGRGGFNQEVEDTFRHEHAELEPAYQKLDRLMADPAGQASLGEIVRFMREGELMNQNGGGQ